jgi:PLD-like domain
MSDTGTLKMSDAVRASFAPVLKALGAARQALASEKDVVTVRPGYYYPTTGQPVPAVVVAVTPGTAPVSAADLAKRFGVAFSLTDATVEEQVAAQEQGESPVSFAATGGPTASAFEALLTGEDVTEFGPPKEGAYEPLDPPDLPLIDEPMKATICVSPEAGWGELETFLAGTKERLTVAMYQFTAPHIFEAVRAAVSPAGRTFELVLHPRPEKPPRSGVKANDLDEEDGVLKPLTKKMKDRFKVSWATLTSKATPDGLWASAYHIKVAVRDGETTWLSSGNWQSSNQPDVHPFEKGHDQLPAGFQRKYNRDYHAVIENEKLASAYETYIKRDYELTSAEGKPEAFALPDLFVPEEEPEGPVAFAAPPQFFQPLRLDRRIKVQPLLTPDNYAENALKLIRSAKKSVWYQNQYINFRGTGEDFNEFRLLVSALKKKIDDGLDVRIICRDMMKQESVDVLVGLGFPRAVMRFQPACHNKTIIVDGKAVMFGSHNWSNEGVKTNRDASLIFYDEEVAGYLAEVYEYDWDRLATAKPTPKHPRVAKQGEATPKGHQRVPFSAVFDD